MRALVVAVLFFLLGDVTGLSAQQSRLIVSVADQFGRPFPGVRIEVAEELRPARQRLEWEERPRHEEQRGQHGADDVVEVLELLREARDGEAPVDATILPAAARPAASLRDSPGCH